MHNDTIGGRSGLAAVPGNLAESLESQGIPPCPMGKGSQAASSRRNVVNVTHAVVLAPCLPPVFRGILRENQGREGAGTGGETRYRNVTISARPDIVLRGQSLSGPRTASE